MVYDQAFELAVKENKFVLIDFWAQWCAPCKSFSPIFEEFASENKHIKCLKIDIDKNQEVAVKCEVKSIPTIVFIKDGNVVGRKIGMMSKNALQELVEKLQ